MTPRVIYVVLRDGQPIAARRSRKAAERIRLPEEQGPYRYVLAPPAKKRRRR